MNNPNTSAPSVNTSKSSSDSSNFDFEKFRKAYSFLYPKNTNTNNSTSGLSAFGDALSNIASAYMATDGFNFDKTPSAKIDKPTV